MNGHHVYLALTRDGAYYCGYAVDPEARLAVHNAGRGAKILRGKLPVVLAYVRRFATKSAALHYEYTLKGRTHGYKRTLARRWLATRNGRLVPRAIREHTAKLGVGEIAIDGPQDSRHHHARAGDDAPTR